MFLFTCRGFRLMLHVDFVNTSDEWRHGTPGVVLVCVHWCLCLSDPGGFLYLLGSSVSLFINAFCSLPVYDVTFSRCMVCYGGFVEVRHWSFSRSLCICHQSTETKAIASYPRVQWCHLLLVLTKSMYNVGRKALQVKKSWFWIKKLNLLIRNRKYLFVPDIVIVLKQNTIQYNEATSV